MLQITYSDLALKFLRRINKSDRKKIVLKINQYACDPESLKNQVKKLINSGSYRLRVGGYRIIFSKNGTIMKIEKIGNRGDVYRRV